MRNVNRERLRGGFKVDYDRAPGEQRAIATAIASSDSGEDAVVIPNVGDFFELVSSGGKNDGQSDGLAASRRSVHHVHHDAFHRVDLVRAGLIVRASLIIFCYQVLDGVVGFLKRGAAASADGRMSWLQRNSDEGRNGN